MSDSVRDAFSQNVTRAIAKLGPKHLTDTFVKQVHTIAWEAHQATESADEKWMGVVEKLVGALEYVEANYDGMNKAVIVRQALAQAERLMRSK